MISLRNPLMRNAQGILDTKEKVRRARKELEEKTEKDFRKFAQSKQNVRGLAHDKKLR